VEWMQFPREAIWGSEELSLEHTRMISSIIGQFDADIWNFAELGDCESLTVLNDIINERYPHLYQMYRPYLLKGTDTSTHQNVGILTKIDPITPLQRSSNRVGYPLSETRCCSPVGGHPFEPCRNTTQPPKTTGVSKHSFSLFETDDFDVLLVSVHFLAFPTEDFRCQKREAQATLIAEIIQQEFEQHQLHGKKLELIVAGDFNDYDPSVVDANHSVPTSRVLDIIKQALSSKFPESHPIPLLNVAHFDDKNPSQVYSAWWDRNNNCIVDGDQELTLIDQVLVSPNLASYITEVSFETALYSGSCENIRYSDHWPIRVEFDFSD